MRFWLQFGLFFSLWFAAANHAWAGSATWNLDPTSGDWNTAANWTPLSVPNGPSDIATFAESNQTTISISEPTEVSELAFTAGADEFEITVNPLAVLTVSGLGISNESGLIQKLIAMSEGSSDAEIDFINSAIAGMSVRITNAAPGTGPGVARTRFDGDSSAGEAVILNEGSTASGPGGNGVTIFYGSSSAADATITNTGGTVPGAENGAVFFNDRATAAHSILTSIPGVEGAEASSAISFGGKTTAGTARLTNLGGRSENAPGAESTFQAESTAANSTIVNEGGVALNAGGGFTTFFDNSTADNSSLIANTGIAGGQGGYFAFFGNSGGGTVRVTLLGGGALHIDGHNSPGMKIGSVTGSGLIFLGANRLTIGTNDLDSTFTGVIDDSGLGGSLRKIGDRSLVLAGANTYTGKTTVNRGTLIVNNTTGSGTGFGPVAIDSGRLAGQGIIAGAVTIGDGVSNKAVLSPGVSGVGVLTLQSTLSFAANSAYNWNFAPDSVEADEVTALGVTIAPGARFVAVGRRGTTLPLGTIFVAINNTSSLPIEGTFTNLADGAVLTVNGNNFQASYSGGDGNDLTLTVVP